MRYKRQVPVSADAAAFDLGLLVGGLLVLCAVLASKISTRASVPVLVLFLLLGMLAGSEGIGGLAFEDYTVASQVATVALAFILFDGGLGTPAPTIRAAWRPAAVLATFGVVLTALVVALAAWFFLGLPAESAFVLGAVVSSTDAAAVFAILRGQGVSLQPRLSATLELESGSNDPMAVFLTVATLAWMEGELGSPWELGSFFVRQLLVGGALGIALGKGGAWLINRVALEGPGLYPILAASLGILSFATATVLGGSGFLAIYLTGIVLGNTDLVFRQGIRLFHDGTAWLAQIAMFLLLGLLSFPSALLATAGDGLLMAGALIFVARPLAVVLSTLPFGYPIKELLLLSWGGLKGAVPIVLAIFPLLAGVEGGRYIFDLVFFVVLVSALTQGWSLPVFARRLGLQGEVPVAPPARLDILSLRHVDAEIIEYAVAADAPAAGRRIRDLPLPEGVLVAMVARDNRLVPPGGATRIRAGDYVFVMSRRDLRTLVDRLFSDRGPERAPVAKLVEFPLRGDTAVRELREYYDIGIEAPDDETLGALIAEGLGRVPAEGEWIQVGAYMLIARTVRHGQVERVALEVMHASGARE